MDTSPVQLEATELAFLQRLLLDLQQQLALSGAAADEERVAALELALAWLRWDGAAPPPLEAQVGLGAAVQMKLGLDAMCAWRHWRNEQRKALALTP